MKSDELYSHRRERTSRSKCGRSLITVRQLPGQSYKNIPPKLSEMIGISGYETYEKIIVFDNGLTSF